MEIHISSFTSGQVGMARCLWNVCTNLDCRWEKIVNEVSGGHAVIVISLSLGMVGNE